MLHVWLAAEEVPVLVVLCFSYNNVTTTNDSTSTISFSNIQCSALTVLYIPQNSQELGCSVLDFFYSWAWLQMKTIISWSQYGPSISETCPFKDHEKKVCLLHCELAFSLGFVSIFFFLYSLCISAIKCIFPPVSSKPKETNCATDWKLCIKVEITEWLWGRASWCFFFFLDWQDLVLLYKWVPGIADGARQRFSGSTVGHK